MPGVPKSRACQSCKARKIKVRVAPPEQFYPSWYTGANPSDTQCDETWPVCFQCKRSSFPCSGPSGLIKFVHKHIREDELRNNTHAESSSGSRTAGAGTASLNMVLARKRAPDGRHCDAGLITFRLVNPRKPLTSPSDQVAARLVRHMNMCSEPGDVLPYISYIPQRLIRSDCLRECTALFCNLWELFCSGRPGPTMRSLGQYGKALKAIRETIQSKNALEVETLGAVTLLEHCEGLLGWGPRLQHTFPHALGLEYLIARKGVPDLNDEFDVALANEQYGMLVIYNPSSQGSRDLLLTRHVQIGYWALRGGSCVCQGPIWETAATSCFEMYLHRIGLSFLPKDDVEALMSAYGEWPTWVQQNRSIRGNSVTCTSMMIEFKERLRLVNVSLRQVRTRMTTLLLTSNFVTLSRQHGESATPQYGFTSTATARVFLAMLTICLLALKVEYSLVLLWQWPDVDGIAGELRLLQNEIIWCIPHMYTAKTFTTTACILPFFLAYEDASPVEQEALLDLALFSDSFLKRHVRNREVLAASMVGTAPFLTGRTSASI